MISRGKETSSGKDTGREDVEEVSLFTNVVEDALLLVGVVEISSSIVDLVLVLVGSIRIGVQGSAIVACGGMTMADLIIRGASVEREKFFPLFATL